jgi:hypothetical protein
MSEKEMGDKIRNLENRISILEGQIQGMDKEYSEEIKNLKSLINDREHIIKTINSVQ